MAAGEIPWEVDETRILVPALTLAWLRPRTSTLALPRSDLALALAQSLPRTATLVCQETIFFNIVSKSMEVVSKTCKIVLNAFFLSRIES